MTEIQRLIGEAQQYLGDIDDLITDLRDKCDNLADTVDAIGALDGQQQPAPQPQPQVVRPGLAGHYALHTQAAGVNGTSLFYWSQIEPVPGQYNWAPIDNWLAARDKGILQVYLHTTDMTGTSYFRVWQPHGLSPYLVQSGGQSAIIPRYDDWGLLIYYQNFISALGERYDGKCAGVVAVTGLDGETQAAKEMGGINWLAACFGTEANAVPHRFASTWIHKVLATFAEAFPHTPVLVDMAPGDRDMRRKVAMAAQAHGIGMKHSGLATDAGNHWGYDLAQNRPAEHNWASWQGEIGSWDPMRVYGGLVGTESVHGMYTGNDARDMLLAGLSYHPTAMVWHPEYASRIESSLTWSEQYLGVTREDTPGVWWRKHESPYPYQRAGNRGGFSGHTDDWCFWLRREGDEFVVDGVDLSGDCQVTIEHTGKIAAFGQEFDGTATWVLRQPGVPQRFTVTGDVTFLEVRRI